MELQPDLTRLCYAGMDECEDDAETLAMDIVRIANEFNASLDEEHEVGVMLASFGQNVTVNITGIGYKGAKLIRFTGYLNEDGTPVELIQHVSQLNFLLIALPRDDTDSPKKQIGFIQAEERMLPEESAT